MEEGIIRCKLTLLLRLLDATTGAAVDERNIRFQKDGENCFAHARGQGCYIFMDGSRENCLMQVSVHLYEPQTIRVDYEKLDPVLPSIDVFLIPSEKNRRGEALLTLKGQISGLEAVEAIHPGRPVTSIRSFDAKKNVMTVFSPNRRINMTSIYYGILNTEKNTFEDIVVAEELEDKRVRLKVPLQEEFSPNSPICKILYGQVFEDGKFLFKVRDDGENLNYLVKYVVNGVAGYKMVDFHHLEGVKLNEDTVTGEADEWHRQ
ncbi:MAG: hypothetical protein K6G07_00700 [Lachnospiraceae bacterium]|nr:hypothetical protein [Lachnospiraceae bacterium]